MRRPNRATAAQVTSARTRSSWAARNTATPPPALCPNRPYADGAFRQSVQHDVEITQLLRVRVVPKPLRLVERGGVLTHAGARKVERHYAESGAGEPLGDVRKEAPILEALETVAHDDDRALAAGARDVAAQRTAVGAGEPERSFRWSGQRLARGGAQ